jgi:hypothetical protein
MKHLIALLVVLIFVSIYNILYSDTGSASTGNCTCLMKRSNQSDQSTADVATTDVDTFGNVPRKRSRYMNEQYVEQSVRAPVFANATSKRVRKGELAEHMKHANSTTMMMSADDLERARPAKLQKYRQYEVPKKMEYRNVRKQGNLNQSKSNRNMTQQKLKSRRSNKIMTQQMPYDYSLEKEAVNPSLMATEGRMVRAKMASAQMY